MSMLLAHVSQPLAYAEALLGQLSSLSRSVDDATLLGDFVQGAARLSGCELAQLYLLDATGLASKSTVSALTVGCNFVRACLAIITMNSCCSFRYARIVWYALMR